MEIGLPILRRFVGATILISITLLIINFIILDLWLFRGVKINKTPSTVVKTVAQNLHASGDIYTLSSKAIKLLNENDAWAMLLSNSGQVIWDYELPSELAQSYSLIDVAKFTRNYLMDYPVFVWEHEKGLVVVGYPKYSLAKYEYIFPSVWVSHLPKTIIYFLMGNAAIALFLSLIIGSRLIYSIRPIIKGIQALAEDKEVFIEPRGILANLSESVNHTSELLKQKNHALKKRDEARSNWITGISHDIRTPLSMVLGYASELEKNNTIGKEERKYAGIIRQNAEKIRTLISDLNLVSMLEYEMHPLNKKPLRPSALVRQIASEFINSGLDERFSIDVEILDEGIQVHGDEHLLLRAITNLVQNCIEHNPKGCQIYLKTAFDANRSLYHITVSDNGQGIAKNELSSLTKSPFYFQRKNPGKNRHGLGLPMVSRIAKAHNGRLILSSDIGKGFKAELVLPCINIKT